MRKMRKITCCVLASLMAFSLVSCEDKSVSKKETGATLSWLVPGDKQADLGAVLTEANKIIEPKIGVKLDLQFIDSGAFSERMTMNMASGTAFDLCFTGYINSYSTAVKRGGLLKLDEYIEKETKDLKKAIPDYMWNGAKFDGSIYAVPNVQTVASPGCIIILKDIADKYNLDINSIKCMKDLEPFLAKVKANEPNMYPYRPNYGVGPWTSWEYEELLNGIVGIRKDGKDTEAVMMRALPEVKDAAKTLRQWFTKGYIREDVASVGDDSQDLKAGKYASWQSKYKPGCEVEGKAQYGRDIVCAIIEEPYVNMDAVCSTMIGVSRTCKNPAGAIKLIELMNTDKKLYNLITYGIEGKHYTLKNGKVNYVDASGYAPKAAWKFGNQFNALLVEGQKDGIWEETIKLNNEAKKSPLLGMVVNTDNIVNEISQVMTIQNEYGVIANGSDDPDKYYDEFMKRLNEAGQQKILDDVQRQIDEFKKN